MSKQLTDEEKQAKKDYQKAWREANKIKLAEYYREYRKNNPESNKNNTKAYRDRNPDKAKESSKNYKEKNQDKIKEARIVYKGRKNELDKARRINDPLWRLKANLRTSILKAFSRLNTKKNNKTVEILGCDYQSFKIYIESKFEPWMDWNNHGKYNGEENFGWDVDHIVPLSTANNEYDIIKLNHYTNLRPLCSKINRDIKRNNPI